MMGRIDNQMQLLILDLDSMIPENHLLRQIKNSVNFDFIYLPDPYPILSKSSLVDLN